MTPRYLPITLRCLALLAWPLITAAQTPATPAPPAFKSAFEGYQPYTDDKTVSWKDANETTARVGGWRAYAKEASRAEPVKPVQVYTPPVSSSKTMAEPAAVKP